MREYEYKSTEYKGYNIKVYYYDNPDCPCVCWDMVGAYLWEWDGRGHSLHSDCNWKEVFGDNNHSLKEAIIALVKDYVSINNIIKYAKSSNDSSRCFRYDKSGHKWLMETYYHSYKKWFISFEANASDLRYGYYVDDLLEQFSQDELLEMIDKYGKDIVCQEWSSTGYCQGDYVSGIGFCTKKRFMEMYDKNAKNWKKRVCESIETETKTIGNWMWGDVYGYKVEDEEGCEIDSCWGFYGDNDIDYGVDEAKSIIDTVIEHKNRVHLSRIDKIKAQIDKLKGKIFIGEKDCYQVGNDMFGQPVLQKSDATRGYVEHFYNDAKLEDVPEDILENMEKAIG